MIDIVGIDMLDDFIIESYEKEKIIMLYFGAEWCGPCKQLKKRLADKETEEMLPNLVVAHLDIEEKSNEELVEKYKINSLPTQVFITLNKNKVIEKARIEGYDFTRLKIEYDKLA